MPTYQYVCTECGTPLEVVQSFTDPALVECPTCGGRLRKVFSAVGVVFKGSGFYRNDSRSEKSAAAATPSTDSKTSDGKAGDSSGSSADGKSSGDGGSGPKSGSTAAPASTGSSGSGSKSGSSGASAGKTSGSSGSKSKTGSSGSKG